jgi:hypothetical protein
MFGRVKEFITSPWQNPINQATRTTRSQNHFLIGVAKATNLRKHFLDITLMSPVYPDGKGEAGGTTKIG